MKEYSIRYRGSYVDLTSGVWLSATREVLEFRCMAKSKVEALMRLVNLEAVHQVLSVERVKDD